jgi:hypothetical protein
LSRDLKRVIQLEVTIPHLVLPTPESSSFTPNTQPLTSSHPEANKEEGAEQVYLQVIDQPGQSISQPAYGMTKSKTLTYASRRGPFHLLHLYYHFKHGQGLLLQILRRCQRGQSRPLQPTSKHIDDEIPCLLEYRPASSTRDSKPIEIIAGVKRIVIMLDEEGVPCRYSIDGAES